MSEMGGGALTSRQPPWEGLTAIFLSRSSVSTLDFQVSCLRSRSSVQISLCSESEQSPATRSVKPQLPVPPSISCLCLPPSATWVPPSISCPCLPPSAARVPTSISCPGAYLHQLLQCLSPSAARASLHQLPVPPSISFSGASLRQLPDASLLTEQGSWAPCPVPLRQQHHQGAPTCVGTPCTWGTMFQGNTSGEKGEGEGRAPEA